MLQMFRHIFLWALLLNGPLAFSQVSSHLGAPKFAPPDGKKLLIIGQDIESVGGLTNYTDGYVDHVIEHIPAGVTTYTPVTNLDGLATFADWGAGDIHAQTYLSDGTFDNTAIVIGLWMVGALDGINGGFFDSTIRELAQWVKDTQRPVFLRIGYEFDGSWNNYNPSKFKDAWIRIVHLFDEEGVKNVAYVWQSAGINNPNIDQWYPGDAYVNWMGYSHFDVTNPGQSIQSFAEERDKPIMIAESTPRVDLKVGSGETHWLNWYYPLFQGIYENDRIKALAYINANWDSQAQWQGQGWGDSRVQVNDFVFNAWTNEIEKDPWITASDTLFDIMNLQTWQDSMVILSTDQISENPETFEITKEPGQLYINSLDQELIDGIEIWDLSGRRLYINTGSAFSYQIPTNNYPSAPILIRIVKQDIIFYRKEFFFGFD